MSPAPPSIDPGSVCVANEQDDGDLNLGISADTAMAYLSLTSDPPTSFRSLRTHTMADALHFADSTASLPMHDVDETLPPAIPAKDVLLPVSKIRHSYDTSWLQTFEGVDDYGALSGESTDFEEHQLIGGDDLYDDTQRLDTIENAEDGVGPIVNGNAIPLMQLNVQRGTTHLLVGGSNTPNLVPTFLSTTLPRINSTLTVLDVSANFLTSLPSALASCCSLEELNISSNPLRVLPLFLTSLLSLRVLTFDSTGISTIPPEFSRLTAITTLSIRRNKFYTLPSWLCLLPNLTYLIVDDNPFQGPWKSLVEPLLTQNRPKADLPPSPPPPPAHLYRSTSAKVITKSLHQQHEEEEGADELDIERDIIDGYGQTSPIRPSTSPKPLPRTPSRNRSASNYAPPKSYAAAEEQRTVTPLSDVRRTKSAFELERRGGGEHKGDRGRDGGARALRSVMGYLRDMNDLATVEHHIDVIIGLPHHSSGLRRSGGEMSSESSFASSSISSSYPVTPELSSTSLALDHMPYSPAPSSVLTSESTLLGGEERKYKVDKNKRRAIVREIVESERTYVRSLQELVDIYITPASNTVSSLSSIGSSGKETTVPSVERKIVFGGIEALFFFHRDSFLPALEQAAGQLLNDMSAAPDFDIEGKISSQIAMSVGRTFISHAAFMKMYSTYINNFDNAVQRIRHWMTDRPNKKPSTTSPSTPSHMPMTPMGSSAQVITVGLSISSSMVPGSMDQLPSTGSTVLSSSQRKRIKEYLRRCRANPRHSQLNLEGYLLLPVQRIPRYRLLLEDLVKCTPPTPEKYDDPLHRALTEISSLATNMNEGKRDAESRRKLVQWQSRIRGKFPSPLVQPHRRLILDGRLRLTRVVRRQTISIDIVNSQGDTSKIQIECLAPEQTPRSLVGILCSDLLILCRDPSGGTDPNASVDLWAVLRMQTLSQPASIVSGGALRIVDDKAILYFDAPSTSEALTWCQAINTHIPLSRTST